MSTVHDVYEEALETPSSHIDGYMRFLAWEAGVYRREAAVFPPFADQSLMLHFGAMTDFHCFAAALDTKSGRSPDGNLLLAQLCERQTRQFR
ncbi:MAG: hypothetical protein OXR66_04605 [Candidatus Woesearchaeota archaeon]|nr:hypothetical protein [Candidatus Woesearchaeota archaeon]